MDEIRENNFLNRTQKKNLSYVVIMLVTVNVLVHLYGMFVNPYIAYKGDLQLESVLQQKEYYRLLTSMFLHADLSHIFNNMFVLAFLGDMLEKEVGHVSFGIIYLASGIGGNVVSLGKKMLTSSNVASLGASGAIFGLDGLLLALVLVSRGRMRKVTLRRTLLMIGLSVYSGYTSGNTDNAAHIGGLVTGFVVGMIYVLISALFHKEKRNGGSL